MDLVVSDRGRAIDFYAAVLAPLGFERRREITGEQGEPVTYIRHPPCLLRGSRPQDRRPSPRGRGAEIESESREYDYTPGYYAVFFLDPDGIKLEVLHRP